LGHAPLSIADCELRIIKEAAEPEEGPETASSGSAAVSNPQFEIRNPQFVIRAFQSPRKSARP
jgi:hypothetical protein